jgi:hypothetical protein
VPHEKRARRNRGSDIVVPAVGQKSPKSRNGTTAQSSLFDFQSFLDERRMVMPVLLVPALFVGGTAVVLGGGYFLLHGLHIIAW